MRGVDVHLVLLDIAGHAKVRDLEALAFSDQDVTTGKVAVDNAKTREILLHMNSGKIKTDCIVVAMGKI